MGKYRKINSKVLKIFIKDILEKKVKEIYIIDLNTEPLN